jgi:hypothetical protein
MQCLSLNINGKNLSVAKKYRKNIRVEIHKLSLYILNNGAFREKPIPMDTKMEEKFGRLCGNFKLNEKIFKSGIYYSLNKIKGKISYVRSVNKSQTDSLDRYLDRKVISLLKTYQTKINNTDKKALI